MGQLDTHRESSTATHAPSVSVSARPSSAHARECIEPTAPEAVPDIVRRARQAQEKWAALPIRERVRTIAQVKNKILSRAEEIAKLVHEETGKPEVEALLGEVLASADLVGYWQDAIAE
ncbi:MAG TPA: aldehyde dehydrogenase family protein, partial [Labilithrix sp.]|nr:aldehyde dehydrogenase family protein [Labilithrix sp.]